MPNWNTYRAPPLNTLFIILWYDNGVGDNGMYLCVCVCVQSSVLIFQEFSFFSYQLRHKWRIWLSAFFFKTTEFTIKCLLFTVLTWWLFLMGPLLEMNLIRTWCVIFLKCFFWFPFDKCLIRIFAYVHKLDFFFWVLFYGLSQLLSVLYWLF